MIYELKFSYYEDNSENNDEIIIAVYSSYKKAEIGKKKFSQQPRFKGKEEFLERFARLFLDLQDKSLNSEISSKTIDLRGMIASLELMKIGLGLIPSLEMGIMDKAFDPYEKEIVMDTCKTLFDFSIKPEDFFEN